ncbi:MAG TPA: DUF4097 family beta strand repeat-containing protein [Bryobacteraceae bacterium]|jgi:hypothetical protein|nr:DUF4097 family beta strand repeat-containing protein [Bryobacteraceae bacterium]
MKRAVLLALTLEAAVFAADYRDVNRTVPLSANGLVEIETHKGSIHVSVWDRPEVEIQARIEAEPGTIMDRRRFDGTDVRIDSSVDSLRIKTYYPDFNWCCSSDSGNNPEVRYTLKMPKKARLTIRDHRSETEISGLQGALDLTTHRGSARVLDLGGALRLDTHRGDIQIAVSSFTANSSITNYRGTVELSMPKSSAFSLQTNSGRHGSVETDFPVMTHMLSRRGQNVQGTVNGGGPTLRIETERGEIRVRAK